MYRLLKSRRDGAAKAITSFAQDLVRIPSVSLDEGRVSDRIKEEMESLGYDQVERDESGNVIGVLQGREAGPTLLLNCHMDTVSAGDEAQWDRPAFSGCIEGNRMYGLGAGDCKGGVASQVHGAALLKRSLLPLRGNVVVGITVAEEHGCSGGVRTLIEQTLPALELEPTYAILGEPTDLGLYYGHDGWMELEVCVEGMNPFHVDDAAHAVLRDLDSEVCVAGDDGEESAVLHGLAFDDVDGRRRATIRVDRRLHVAERPEAVMTRLKQTACVVAEARGSVAVDVAVRRDNQTFYTGKTRAVRHVTNAWAIDPFDQLMQRARQALGAAGCEVRPGKWQLGRLGMGTAGSVLVNDYGIPTLGYGPGNETAIHAPNEWVDVRNVLEAAYGTAAIAHSLVGIPVYGWTSDEI